jgi:hypothetical protein
MAIYRGYYLPRLSQSPFGILLFNERLALQRKLFKEKVHEKHASFSDCDGGSSMLICDFVFSVLPLFKSESLIADRQCKYIARSMRWPRKRIWKSFQSREK